MGQRNNTCTYESNFATTLRSISTGYKITEKTCMIQIAIYNIIQAPF